MSESGRVLTPEQSPKKCACWKFLGVRVGVAGCPGPHDHLFAPASTPSGGAS